MARYIDEAKLVEAIVRERNKIPLTVPCAPYELLDVKANRFGQAQRSGIRIALRCISEIPTADVAEVKHGEWKDYYNNKYNNQLYVCSVCGKRALYEYFKDELDHIKTRQVLSVVCPHCGANMNGGNNG